MQDKKQATKVEAELTGEAAIKELEKEQATLRAKHEQLRAAEEGARNSRYELDEQLRKLGAKLAELREAQLPPLPFERGDVIADELGVHYRVVQVTRNEMVDPYGRQQRRRGGMSETIPANTVWAIRLTKTGIEAHAQPRPVRSPHLTKVEIETEKK